MKPHKNVDGRRGDERRRIPFHSFSGDGTLHVLFLCFLYYVIIIFALSLSLFFFFIVGVCEVLLSQRQLDG